MKLTTSILAGVSALLLGTVSASAADLFGGKGGSIKDGFTPVEQARPVSWYMRGDFSHAWQNVDQILEPPTYRLNSVETANTRSWGAGIGYYFSPNVRGDVTFDFRQNAALNGMLNDGVATVQGERQFGMKNMLVLANVYYDFDTRSRFTPYLGVGLGFSKNQTASGHVVIDGCDPGAGVTPNCAATFDGATQYHGAAALMAGFSAKLHSRIALDAGYRFLYLGDGHTGNVNITRAVPAPGAPDQTPSLVVKDMTAHELRVGLRVDLR